MSKKELRKESSEKLSKKGGSRKSLLNSPQAEQARLARERQLLDALNRENIHKYLKNLELNSSSEAVARRVISSSIQQMEQQLEQGIIDLPDISLPLPELAKAPPKLTPEQIKEQQIKAKREQMQKKIDYLYEQLRGGQNNKQSSLRVEIKDILSKQEHEQKIRQILLDKAELRKRHEQLAEQHQKKLKEIQQKEQQLRALEIQKQKQKRRSNIELNMKKRKQEHKKMIEIDQQLHKKFQSLHKQQTLFQKMEQRYQSQIMLPSLEQKKLKLKELREFHKKYDVDAVKQHEKKYLQRQQEKQKERELGNSQVNSNHYQPPTKTEKLQRLLEEERQQLKNQFEGRKNKNQQMNRRLSLFEKEIMAKHKPKIDNEKKQQIVQRYLEEQKKYQRASVDAKKIGQAYLQIAKKMKRSESQHREVKTQRKESDDLKDRVEIGHPQLQLSRAFNRSNDFYQNLRRKRIEDILNSEQSSVKEKYHMLRLETDKIQEKIKQKQDLVRMGGSEEAQQQAAQLLLSSIQAKMGIMNVLKGKSARTKE